MPSTTHTYEIQLRDTNNHTSDTAAGDSGATVIADNLHPSTFDRFASLRVYYDDDHDASFDVTLEHTHKDDTDFGSAVSGTATTLASGSDAATITPSGPIGRLRFLFQTGALASAPTTGSLRIEVEAVE